MKDQIEKTEEVKAEKMPWKKPELEVLNVHNDTEFSVGSGMDGSNVHSTMS